MRALVSSFVLNLVSPHLPLLPHAQPRAALLFSSNRQRRGESSVVLVVWLWLCGCGGNTITTGRESRKWLEAASTAVLNGPPVRFLCVGLFQIARKSWSTRGRAPRLCSSLLVKEGLSTPSRRKPVPIWGGFLLRFGPVRTGPTNRCS